MADDEVPDGMPNTGGMAEQMANIKSMTAQFELWAETSAYFAKLTKVRFDQYIEVGFTKEQALEIIKARGVSFG
jgi:hypothetical protein